MARPAGDDRAAAGPADLQASDRAEERSGRDAMLLANVQDSVIVTDLDGVVTFWNEGASRLFGFEAAEMVGRPLADRVPPHARGEMAAWVARIAGGKTFAGEWLDYRRDGSRVWIEATTRRIVDAAGDPVGIMGLAHDVSDRKRAEAALHDANARLEARVRERTAELAEANAKFQAVYDQGLFAGLLDLDGTVLDANRACLEQCGFAREDVIGRPFWDCGWWDRSPAVQAWVRAGLARAARGEPFRGESAYWCADGGERVVELAMMPIRDDAGRVRFVLPTGMDVTERRRAEAARRAADVLKESEARFRMMADAMPQIVWAARPDGVLDYYNRRWFEYVDLPADATGGAADGAAGAAAWDRHVHPEDLPRVYSEWARAVRDGAEYAAEFRVRRADGAFRWFLVRALPARDAAGAVVRWFGTCTDVDDQRRLRDERERVLAAERAARAQAEASAVEAEAANAAKGRYLAFLAHELRGPLTPALLAAAAMATDAGLPAEARADAAMIRRNIELTTRLADDLLDANRIALGKLELRVEPADAHELLRAGLAMCAADAAAKGVRLELALRATRHVVDCDPPKLTQVWTNLVKNAIKFTPAAGVVAARTSDGPGGRLRVEVADTGVGVDAALLTRMFDLYEQGERSVTRDFAGLGLGLAICKGIVGAHGGTIAAASDGRGRGTTMTVELPGASAPARPPTIRPPPAPAAATAPAPGLRILLVDDHEDTLRAMSRLLSRLRHRVTTAASVGAALSAASAGEFDLLISDVGLPDGTGLDLMRELLRRRPIRGIALTGYGTASDVEQTLAAGFEAHLTKPIDLERLEALIRQVDL